MPQLPRQQNTFDGFPPVIVGGTMDVLNSMATSCAEWNALRRDIVETIKRTKIPPFDFNVMSVVKITAVAIDDDPLIQFRYDFTTVLGPSADGTAVPCYLKPLDSLQVQPLVVNSLAIAFRNPEDTQNPIILFMLERAAIGACPAPTGRVGLRGRDGTITSIMHDAGYSTREVMDYLIAYVSRLATAGETGSGAFVRATSPTITTPTVTDVNASTGSRGQIMVLDASAAGTSGIAWCNPFYAMAREIIRSSRHRLGWYKAGFLNLSDSDAVATWADLSGVGNDLTQGTANARPTFKTNIINGKPVVRFEYTSTGDYLDVPNMFGSVTAAETFIVAKADADPPAAAGDAGWWQIGSDGATGDHWPYADGNIYDGFGSTARKATGNPTLSLSSAFRVYNVTTRSGEWTSRIDGTQHFTTGTNTVGFTASGRLGSSSLHSEFFNGDIAEWIMLDCSDAALATSLRDIITNYLLFEYGL